MSSLTQELQAKLREFSPDSFEPIAEEDADPLSGGTALVAEDGRKGGESVIDRLTDKLRPDQNMRGVFSVQDGWLSLDLVKVGNVVQQNDGSGETLQLLADANKDVKKNLLDKVEAKAAANAAADEAAAERAARRAGRMANPTAASREQFASIRTKDGVAFDPMVLTGDINHKS
jgi:hypothetical protein